jgi:membrane-bound ClpP family serine protease
MNEVKMDEVKTKKKRIKLISIILYIVGAFLFLFGVGLCAIHYLLALGGIFSILAGIIIIHSTAKNMGKKLEISISGIEKFLMVVILLELTYMAVVPAPCTWIASS